jgi:trigger factor
VVEDETVFERDGLRMSPEAPPPGVEADAFLKALTGAKVNDERELPVTIPADFPEVDEAHRGQDATCLLKITEAFEMIPASDEELAKMLESDDIDAARTKARRQMAEAREEQERNRQETVLLNELIDAHEFELPASMVESQTTSRVEELTQQLTDQGLEGDELESEVKRRSESTRGEVEKGSKAFFLVSELADQEEIRVTQEDISTELSQIAQRNQATVEEVVKYYRENGLLDQVAVELIERKVRRFLRENANVQDPA